MVNPQTRNLIESGDIQFLENESWTWTRKKK